MRKRIGMLMLSIVGLMVMVGCNDEEKNFDSLSVSEVALSLDKGETGTVTISGGSGSYQVEVADPSVVQAELNDRSLLVSGLAAGESSVRITDNQSRESCEVHVVVDIPYAETTVNQLISLFEGGADAVGSELANSEEQSEELDYSTATDYRIQLLGRQMELRQEKIGSQNIVFTISPSMEATDRPAVFSSLLDEAMQGNTLIAAFVNQYDENGDMPSEQRRMFQSVDAFKEALAEADWANSLIMVGFKTADGETIVEVRSDRNQVQLVVRSHYTNDTWKWYFQFLGQDFNQILMRQYYQVTSAGMLPPEYQLFMMDGKEKHGYALNVIFYAPLMSTPISQVELSFKNMKDEEGKSKQAWLQLLSSETVEDDFGEFEQTIIYPLDYSQDVTTLTSLQATIDWVKNNDLAAVESVMPLFRTGEKFVIVPQLTSTSLIVIVTELERQQSVAARNLRHRLSLTR